MDNSQVTTSSISSANTPLQLRKDDVITTAFVLKTIFVLTVLLISVSAILRWLSKRQFSTGTDAKKITQGNNIRIISSTKTSVRTKIILLDVDGHQAVLIETPQGSELKWVPTQNNIELIKGEK